MSPIHMHSTVAFPWVSRVDPRIGENIYDVNVEVSY